MDTLHQPLPTLQDVDLNKFVSLGDNCEFAFLQQSEKADVSSFFRWAYTNPSSVLAAFKGDFQGVFKFENLTPYARSMVVDSHYGIAFHTKMLSENKVFKEDEAARRKIHAEEEVKFRHLAQKLRDQLRLGEHIFVYKSSGPLDETFARNLGSEISKRGPGILLVVYDEGDSSVGVTRHLDQNVMVARIDRFAPMSKANAFSAEGWAAILHSALIVRQNLQEHHMDFPKDLEHALKYNFSKETKFEGLYTLLDRTITSLSFIDSSYGQEESQAHREQYEKTLAALTDFIAVKINEEADRRSKA